jgi:GNAT superfamily N-acetyltransferase
MDAGPHVWVAGPNEAETVARLLVEFRDHLGYDRPSENAVLAGVEKLLEDVSTEFLIGAPNPDAPPAGVAQLRFRRSIWMAADCLVEDVFVADGARGAGLGRALVTHALERARARGCRRAELDVSEVNEAALALYASLGFGASAEGAPRDLYLRAHLDPVDE